MSKDNLPQEKEQEFNPILNILTQFLSYVTNGSVRVDVDNQPAIEIKGHSKGKKSDLSIDIEEHGDRLFTAALVYDDITGSIALAS
jgi:hypothetical protein